MKKFVIYLSLFMVSSMNGGLFAQEETTTTEKKKGPDMEMALEMTQTIMIKMFEKAGLTDEQTEKITAIVEENVKPLVYTRQEFQDVLTPEERRKYNSAKKQARKANYDDEKAEKFALKKLKLTDERMKAYKELGAKVKALNEKINNSIGAILTDEQKEKLPIFKKAKAKKEGSDSKGSGNK